jgi:hypothetical protein
VKVPDSEGAANHTGPESCVVHREVYGEALTGESVGQLSRCCGGGQRACGSASPAVALYLTYR